MINANRTGRRGVIRGRLFPGRLLLVLVILAAGACDRNRKTTGWDYFPDMAYSNAYETYSPNPNFPDGKTEQAPVDGTVPREELPFPYGPSIPERIRAGKELVNPLEATEGNLARGKEEFGVFCAQCHGEKGNGQGFLFTSGLYRYPVRTLISDEMKKRPDGEIFHTITLGFGVMGAHGEMIRPDDRWKIILYIRHDLQAAKADN